MTATISEGEQTVQVQESTADRLAPYSEQALALRDALGAVKTLKDEIDSLTTRRDTVAGQRTQLLKDWRVSFAFLISEVF